MKVDTIIRPERLDQVKTALEERGFTSMTISEVSGRGEQRGIKLRFKCRNTNWGLRPKVKIELIVCDHEVDLLINTIFAATKTGNFGDGRIFVMPVARSIKIRTCEEMTNLSLIEDATS